jgi:hypothetical protein
MKSAEKYIPRHTALIIPDGRSRIYDRDPALGRTEKHGPIAIPARDVYVGRMSALLREYAERFYPGDWFILSTNSNDGQPWLVHPDTPVNGDYDNPPYPVPPRFTKSGTLRYWQPFHADGSLKEQLVREAEGLGLLPAGDGKKRYTRIIFLGNGTKDPWWSQPEWDAWLRDNPGPDPVPGPAPGIRDDLTAPIYTAYREQQYLSSPYVAVIKALFRQSGIWYEFPLLDCPTEAAMMSRVSDALCRQFPLHRSRYALKKIALTNLFGMDNPDFTWPDLPLGTLPGVRILTAPNGYGKSTIFRLIRAVLKGNLQEIATIPFESAELTLHDGKRESVLRVAKTGAERNGNGPRFTITLRREGWEPRVFPPEEEQDGFVLRYGDPAWVEETAHRLGEVIPPIPLRFLSAERLFRDPLSKVYPYDLLAEYDEDIFSENLSRARYDARSLARRINGALTDYAATSHKLDMQFPVALAGRSVPHGRQEPAAGPAALRDRFSLLKGERRQLEEIDLLPFRKWYRDEIDPYAPGTLPEDAAVPFSGFLDLYLEGQLKKYRVFDWLNRRCQLFETILNGFFIFTRIRIRRDEGFSFYNLYEREGRYHEVGLDQISSGEMHQVVLYYEFLFNCDPGTIVLIDEPEISLHVYAQSLFIDNIRKIAGENNLQFIVATHSPTIIGDHGDLTCDLLTGEFDD